MVQIQQRARDLAARGVFTGGPVDAFERVGRSQLALLVEQGLSPWHRLVDVGCGALRGGYWMIHFLRPNCYFGIEPATDMLAAGLECVLEPEVRAEKNPTFAHGDDFDLTCFGVPVDVVLARSIWTHASKAQIAAMLASFARAKTPEAFLLASYLPSGRLRRRDYRGEGWVGVSHESSAPGLVRHDRRWIESEAGRHGLSATELSTHVENGQRWLRIS